MKLKQAALTILVGTQLALPALAVDDATIEALKQQIQELDQKVRILERQRELDQDSATTASKAAPKLTLSSSGFTGTSADSNFVFSLKGVVQLDSRTFFNDGPIRGNDGFLLRRARPIFQGTVFHDFDFNLTPDFGGSAVTIFDAYLNYRYEPWLQLRAGKFKVPVGLELLQSDLLTSFNERTLLSDLMPNRDLGVQLWGDIKGGVLSYAVGVFNGVGDTRSVGNPAADFEDHRELAGRVFALPFKNSKTVALQNLGFGVGASWGIISPNATGLPNGNGYATDGQQQFFAYNPVTPGGVVLANGAHWRISPQAYYYYGPLSLLGEYAISDQHVSRTTAVFPSPLPASADLQNTAWQITAGWVLTGEAASYTGVTPRHAFDPRNGSWGAFQIVARYAVLDIDNKTFPTFADPTSSASAAQAWSAGLNWFLNKDIRVNLSYSRTTFSGGGTSGAATAPNVVTAQPENVLFTRIQLAF
jgi:phosphate-selective porin OprO/OprP